MSEQLELDIDDTKEEQTEEGLDKVIQAQEERNQKDYEENKYRNRELQRRAQERKNQQLDIPGILEARSGFRTTLAIGTEVGLNTILDLFSADPTQLTQIFGAQGINYIAQRIRGGEFSRGEMIASGLASLLPGGAQAKSLGGTIGRTALRGGVSGAIETGAADLIDTGEIDARNVVAGGAIGTTFGGLFGTAAGQKPTKQFFKRLQARMGSNLNPEQAVFTPEELRKMGIGQPLMSVNPKPQLTMKNRGRQTVLFFPHENIANRPNQPTPIGTTAQLLAGKTPVGSPQKPRGFKKPGEVDLSKYNWSTPQASARSTNRYERLINDLIEADDISKNDISKGDLFNIRGKRLLNSTTDSDLATELYTDYLTGYFNKYVRSGIDPYFLNATKLTLVKPSGANQRLAMQDLLRDLRLYYMNPDEFATDFFGSSKAAKQTRGQAIEDFLTRYRLPKYIGKTTTFEAHHLNVIDEGWPLFVGLPDREVPEMRRLLQQYGIFSGNDPNNITMIPRNFHLPIIHGQYWPRFRPSWAGRQGDRLLKNVIARIPTAKGRETFVREYATAMQLVNREIDQVLLEYAMKVRGTSRNIGSIANYLSSQAGNVQYTPTKPGDPRYDPRVIVDEKYLGRQTSEGRDLTQAEINKEIQKQIDEQGIYGQGYSPEDPQS